MANNTQYQGEDYTAEIGGASHPPSYDTGIKRLKSFLKSSHGTLNSRLSFNFSQTRLEHSDLQLAGQRIAQAWDLPLNDMFGLPTKLSGYTDPVTGGKLSLETALRFFNIDKGDVIAQHLRQLSVAPKSINKINRKFGESLQSQAPGYRIDPMVLSGFLVSMAPYKHQITYSKALSLGIWLSNNGVSSQVFNANMHALEGHNLDFEKQMTIAAEAARVTKTPIQNINDAIKVFYPNAARALEVQKALGWGGMAATKPENLQTAFNYAGAQATDKKARANFLGAQKPEGQVLQDAIDSKAKDIFDIASQVEKNIDLKTTAYENSWFSKHVTGPIATTWAKTIAGIEGSFYGVASDIMGGIGKLIPDSYEREQVAKGNWKITIQEAANRLDQTKQDIWDQKTNFGQAFTDSLFESYGMDPDSVGAEIAGNALEFLFQIGADPVMYGLRGIKAFEAGRLGVGTLKEAADPTEWLTAMNNSLDRKSVLLGGKSQAEYLVQAAKDDPGDMSHFINATDRLRGNNANLRPKMAKAIFIHVRENPGFSDEELAQHVKRMFFQAGGMKGAYLDYADKWKELALARGQDAMLEQVARETGVTIEEARTNYEISKNLQSIVDNAKRTGIVAKNSTGVFERRLMEGRLTKTELFKMDRLAEQNAEKALQVLDEETKMFHEGVPQLGLVPEIPHPSLKAVLADWFTGEGAGTRAWNSVLSKMPEGFVHVDQMPELQMRRWATVSKVFKPSEIRQLEAAIIANPEGSYDIFMGAQREMIRRIAAESGYFSEDAIRQFASRIQRGQGIFRDVAAIAAKSESKVTFPIINPVDVQKVVSDSQFALERIGKRVRMAFQGTNVPESTIRTLTDKAVARKLADDFLQFQGKVWKPLVTVFRPAYILRIPAGEEQLKFLATVGALNRLTTSRLFTATLGKVGMIRDGLLGKELTVTTDNIADFEKWAEVTGSRTVLNPGEEILDGRIIDRALYDQLGPEGYDQVAPHWAPPEKTFAAPVKELDKLAESYLYGQPPVATGKVRFYRVATQKVEGKVWNTDFEAIKTRAGARRIGYVDVPAEEVASYKAENGLYDFSSFNQRQVGNGAGGFPTARQDVERIAAVKDSIQKNGFDMNRPIEIAYNPESRTMQLSEGWHRLWASRELGLTRVPVKIVPVADKTFDTPAADTWLFPKDGMSTAEYVQSRVRNTQYSLKLKYPLHIKDMQEFELGRWRGLIETLDQEYSDNFNYFKVNNSETLMPGTKPKELAKHLDVWGRSLVDHGASGTLGHVVLQDIADGKTEAQILSHVEEVIKSRPGRQALEDMGIAHSDVQFEAQNTVDTWRRLSYHSVDPEVGKNVARAALEGDKAGMKEVLDNIPVDSRPWVEEADAIFHAGKQGPWARVVDKFGKLNFEIPHRRLSHQPFGKVWYSRAMRQMVETADANGVKITTELHALMDRQAQEFAGEMLKNTMLDFSTHSRLSEMMGIVFPFFNPYEQTWAKWAHIIHNNPAVAGWVYHIDKAAKDSGIIFNDPQTGQSVFNSSWFFLASPVLYAMTGVKGARFLSPVSGLNLFLSDVLHVPTGNIAGDLPIPAPAANPLALDVIQHMIGQEGQGLLGKHLPKALSHSIADWAFHYGPTRFGSFFPTWIQNTVIATVPGSALAKQFGSEDVLKRSAIEFYQEQVRRFGKGNMDLARSQARNFAIFNVFKSLLFISAPNIEFPNDRIREEYNQAVQKYGLKDASDLLSKKYPDLETIIRGKYFQSVGIDPNLDVNPITGYNQADLHLAFTEASRAIMSSPTWKAFSKDYPEWAWALIPRDVRNGKFDLKAWGEAFDNGLLDVYDPGKWEKNLKIQKGWDVAIPIYDQFKADVSAHGFSPGDEGYNVLLRERDLKLQEVQKDFPEWGNLYGPDAPNNGQPEGVNPIVLAQAKMLVKQDVFAQTDLGQAMIVYLHERDIISKDLAKIGSQQISSKNAQKAGLTKHYEDVVAELTNTPGWKIGQPVNRGPDETDFGIMFDDQWKNDLLQLDSVYRTPGEKAYDKVIELGQEKQYGQFEKSITNALDRANKAVGNSGQSEAYNDLRNIIDSGYHYNGYNPTKIWWAQKDKTERQEYKLGLIGKPYIFYTRFDREILGIKTNDAAEAAWNAYNARVTQTTKTLNEVHPEWRLIPGRSKKMHEADAAYARQLAKDVPLFGQQIKQANDWTGIFKTTDMFKHDQSGSWHHFADAVEQFQHIANKNEWTGQQDFDLTARANWYRWKSAIQRYAEDLMKYSVDFKREVLRYQNVTGNQLVDAFIPENYFPIGG